MRRDRLTVKPSVKLAKPRPAKDDPDDLWGFVKDKYDIGMDARRPFEQQWALDLAFFAGKQYTFFNSYTHTLHHLEPVKGRVRLVDNQLMPKVRRQIADSIKNDPTMSVVPNTSADDDMKAAQVGNKLLKHFWRSNKMKTKVRQLQVWRFVTGNAFLDDRWNPKLGPTSVVKGDNGQNEVHYAGDADCGVWSPFEVLFPAIAMGDTDLHRFPWMIKTKYRHIDWIRQNYKRGNEVTSEDMPQTYTDNLTVFGLSSSFAANKVEGATVIEFYLQPTEEYPEGLFVIASNGIVLESKTYPFNHYHIEHFKDIDVPGIFWGMSTMHLGIPLQKSWNRTISGVDEFNKKMAKGKGLVPRGANLEALPDDNHGEWLEYTPKMGIKPEIMTLKGLPQTYELMLSICRTSLEDLFSQHEVTRGTNKSDIRSGDMVQLLLEQDAHGQIPSAAIFEEGMEACMSRILKRIQKGYTEERSLKIMGTDKSWEIISFQGADLNDNTDVHVERESSMPSSRVAREAMIIDRFERGFYGNPQDKKTREHVHKMIENAVPEDIYVDDRQDRDNAEIENMTMAQSQGKIDKLMVNIYDDHEIHVEAHRRFVKSREFQRIKTENPQAFQALDLLFMQHMKQHQQFIAQAQQQQMQMAAAFEAMKKGSSGETKTQ